MIAWAGLGGCRPAPGAPALDDGPLPGTAVVTFDPGGFGGEAVVEYASDGQAWRATPPRAAADGEVPLVGLRAGRPLAWRLRLTDGRRTWTSPRREDDLAPEPEGTAAFRVARQVPDRTCLADAVVLTTVSSWQHHEVRALDATGATVWMVPDDDDPITIWRARPGPDGVTWLASDEARLEDRSALGFVRWDGGGRTSTPAPLAHHDFVASGDGSPAWLRWAFRDLALPALGAADPDPVVADELAGPAGAVWSLFDGVDWPDGIEVSGPEMERCPTVPGAPDGFVPGHCEYAHANSLLWLPDDGLFLVMLRWLDGLAAVDAATGRTRWVFGGPHDTGFTGTDPRFVHAHASEAWRDAEGLLHVLVTDNHDPPPGEPADGSVFAEYVLDEARRTYTRPWAFETGEFTGLLGDVRRIPGCDNRLVSSSAQGRLFEVAPDGEITWDVDLVTGNVTGRAEVLDPVRAGWVAPP